MALGFTQSLPGAHRRSQGFLEGLRGHRSVAVIEALGIDGEGDGAELRGWGYRGLFLYHQIIIDNDHL